MTPGLTSETQCRAAVVCGRGEEAVSYGIPGRASDVVESTLRYRSAKLQVTPPDSAAFVL